MPNSRESAKVSRRQRDPRRKRAADSAKDSDVPPVDSIHPAGSASETPVSPQPTVLLISDDIELAKLLAEAALPPWTIQRRRGARLDRGLLALVNVRIIALDDTAIGEPERDQLLGQIRRHMAGADLLYIAAQHSPVLEKHARASGAHYYTFKPIKREQFVAVLKSFMRART